MREIAGQIAENSKALVSSIIQKAIGQEVTEFVQIIGHGFNNAVTVASTSKGRFVVRTNVESHLFRFQREAWCLRQLSDKGVLVPEVLGCGLEAGHSYSLARFVEESSPIRSELDQLRVWKTLGKHAASLNSISESIIDAEVKAHKYFPMRWKDQVASDVDLIFKENFWIMNKELSNEEQNWLEEFLRQSADLNSPLGVCQFDLNSGNALICDADYDRIYLIDLEWANIAPVPLYQLACIAAEHGTESDITAAFFEGYGMPYKGVREDNIDLNRLTLLRAMRATAWARDRAPTLIEENLRRTRPLIIRALSYRC